MSSRELSPSDCFALEVIASVATAESDAALEREWRAKGYKAKCDGIPPGDCPVSGLLAAWWWRGYQSAFPPGEVIPLSSAKPTA